jgi:solute carrier family 25 S-adenosylmethionine transporter 26
MGSAPSASLFFVTYESLKNSNSIFSGYVVAASLGEISACLVRVPTDVCKQRMQVGMFKSVPLALKFIIKNEGVLGLYRGFGMTVFREIPFASIQFPLYEYLKKRSDSGLIGALGCGAISGGIAAAITTPLDVYNY